MLKKFGSKQTKSYDFLLKAGTKFKYSVYNVLENDSPWRVSMWFQKNSFTHDMETERTSRNIEKQQIYTHEGKLLA